MSHQNLLANNPIGERQLEQLRNAAGAGPVLILTHDSPDPDALAAGQALATLLQNTWEISTEMLYCGLVARAENQAMLQLLATGWKYTERFENFERYSAIAMVDTQPSAGNNSLPHDVLPQIVIDHHHPLREQLKQVKYADVRPETGATTTLLYQYLAAAGIIPSPDLATAMFYGLQTDTRGLARDATPVDEVVYIKLLAWLDRRKLIQVEQAGLPQDYFRTLVKGLQAARIYGRVVVAYLGSMSRPDMPAEMADVLLRLDTARAALCLGTHNGVLYLSLRTEPLTQDAGLLIQKVIDGMGQAGGHGTVAGGQVVIGDRQSSEVADEITKRLLDVLKEDAKPEALIPDQETL